ncbi:hypothetical protein NEOLEDRAFT_1149400 [Neolentinus lepideus HHB14362 ss-1]|uniref:DUF6534 domain-containing protein n=1 Tax=Neolentinus lepideus HHB14362 ss-1 TaxID=1314782 RepID=A0A165R3T3_9AGAM|nr:hypothetical protein NEOLEDRAFT_1149400 [Neolentinus lepideus HHB14362 ss-1]
MDISSTLAALLEAAIVSTMLYGVLIGQTYRYFNAYPDDSVRLKIVPSSLTRHSSMVFKNASSSTLCGTFSSESVKGIHSPTVLSGVTRFVLCLFRLQEFLVIPTSLYLRRIWVFRKRKLAYILSWVWVRFTQHFVLIQALMTFKGSAYPDLAIAVSMCRILYVARSDSPGISRSMIQSLINWTMGTGIIITVCVMIFLVLVGCLWDYIVLLALAHVTDHFYNQAVTAPLDSTLVPGSVYLVGAELYANSMLAALNNREALRDRLGVFIVVE